MNQRYVFLRLTLSKLFPESITFDFVYWNLQIHQLITLPDIIFYVFFMVSKRLLKSYII